MGKRNFISSKLASRSRYNSFKNSFKGLLFYDTKNNNLNAVHEKSVLIKFLLEHIMFTKNILRDIILAVLSRI